MIGSLVLVTHRAGRHPHGAVIECTDQRVDFGAQGRLRLGFSPYCSIDIMLVLRLAMIQTEPAMTTKDFEFSRRTMEEHWQTGYSNARQTLANPEVQQRNLSVHNTFGVRLGKALLFDDDQVDSITQAGPIEKPA